MANTDDVKMEDSSKSLIDSAANFVFGAAGGTPVTQSNNPLFFNSSRDTESTSYKIKTGVGVQKDGGKIHAFKYDCVPNDYTKNKFGAKIAEAIEKIKSAEDSKIIPAQYELHSILHVAYEDLVASGTEDMPSFLYLAESANHAITKDVKEKIGELQYDGGVCLALVTELILSEKDLLVTSVEPRPDEDFSPVAALNELYVTKVYAFVTSFDETAGVLLNHGVDPNWQWFQELRQKAPTLDKLAELDYKDLQATIKPEVANPAANQIANDSHEKIVHQLYTGQIGSPSAGPASTVPPTRTYLADNNATLDFISKVEDKMNKGWKDNEDSTNNGKKKNLSSMDSKSIYSMVTSLCNDMGVTDRDEKSRLHNIIGSAKEDDVRNKGRPVRRSPESRRRAGLPMRGKVKNMAVQRAKSKTTRTMVSKAMTGVGKKVAQKALTKAAAKGLLKAGARGLLGAAAAAGTGAAGLLGAMGGPVGLAIAALPMLIENGEAQKAIAQEMLDQNKAANESAVEQNRNLLQDVQLDLDHSEADAAAKDTMASVQKDPSLQLSNLQGMGLQRLAEALAPDFSPSTMSAIKPYATDAALVAAVDSGRILRAISFFTNEVELITTPRESFLGVPKYVDMMGASMPFTTELHRSTSEDERNSFLNTSTHSSQTVAKKSNTTFSASRSVKANSWFVRASEKDSNTTEHSNTTSITSNFKGTNVKDTKSKETMQQKVKKVYVTEFTYMPVKTVRLNTGGLLLSEFALHKLHKICNINGNEFPEAESQETEKRSRARQYLKQFGSHIPYGVQTLGGIFIRKMELTSQEDKESTELYSSALQQLSDTKSVALNETSAGASGGFLGIGKSDGRSASFSHASSSGFAGTNSAGVGLGGASQSRNESYNCEVVCYGPCAADRDTMYQQLMNNNATWAVIDRGEPDNFVPIWKIIGMMGQGTHYTEEVKLLREQWEEMALTNSTSKQFDLMRIIMPNYEVKYDMFTFVELLAMCYVPLDFSDAAGKFKLVVESAAKAQVDGFFADPSSFISNGFGDGYPQTFRLNEGSKHWENAKNLMQHIVPHHWNDCVVYQYHQDMVVRGAKPNFFSVMCKEAFNEYEDNLRIETEQNPGKTNDQVKQLAMDATSLNWESIEKIIEGAKGDKVKNAKVWLSFQDEDNKYPLNYAMYSGKESLIKSMYLLYPEAWEGSVPKPLNYIGYVAAEKILDNLAHKPNLHELQEAERLASEKKLKEEEAKQRILEQERLEAARKAQREKDRLRKVQESAEKARKERGQDTLKRRAVLHQGQSIKSKNGKYVLVMQSDGNLVGHQNGSPFWTSHTRGKGKGPYRLYMREDGNAEITDSSRQRIWNSNTWHKGHHLVMQDDRNIVVCSENGRAVWTSGSEV